MSGIESLTVSLKGWLLREPSSLLSHALVVRSACGDFSLSFIANEFASSLRVLSDVARWVARPIL